MAEGSNKYKAYFTEAPTGIFVVDALGRYQEANTAACALVGRSRDELLAMSIAEMVETQALEETLRMFQELVHKGTVAKQEIPLLHKDGSLVHVTLDAARISDDRYVGYCSDISKQKEAEARLRESELRFRFTVDQFPALVWAVDTELCFTSSFGAGLASLGLESGEVVGKSLQEYFGTEDKEFLPLKNHRRALAGEYSQYEFSTGDRVFDTHLRPLQDSAGEITGVIGVAFDVTDRVAAHRRETEMQAQGQHLRKLESLSVLAGGIAHDFNNLLMSIAGNAEMALQKNPESDSELKQIAEAAQRAAHLTNQMLAFSGKGALAVRPVNLSEIVREASSSLDGQIAETASVVYRLAQHLPVVESDDDQLRQIVVNLIVNALEALGDEPGEIVVSTSAGYCDASMLESKHVPEQISAGEYITLEVSDSGSGMNAETLKSMFDPFYSTKFTGRGLGLAVVLGVVRSQNGTVQVETNPDGTSIRVRLPVLARKPSVPAEPIRPSAKIDTQSKLVLVVDDETLVRNTIRDMLVSEGYSVILAEDGLDALAQFQARMDEIDCLILDLTMPGLDGVETLQRLRAIKPDVRVIAASGYTERIIAERFREPPSGFLRKPFTTTALVTALNSVLRSED